MADLVLGPMLRHVTKTSATIWLEADHACSVEVLDQRTRTFCVAGRHYALVVIEGLEPASSIEYGVRLDGEQRWPRPASTLPPSLIRTLHDDIAPRIVFGSCRTAAPHIAPWSLEMKIETQGRGVDAMYAYAVRMLDEAPDVWPDLAIFLGDQIYADDSSPTTRARIAARREQDGSKRPDTLPPELVHGFDEFCWLYEESWSSQIERWFLSVVPSVMIFDDHDMIDDWNISADWVSTMRREEWWNEHVIDGLMTYWLYQHLGNLSPTDIRDEGVLESLMGASDGQDILRSWARNTEEITAGRDRYRFSFARDLGRVRLVMIDARNGRALTPGHRRIVDEKEWRWIVESCRADVDHLLIGSSLPAFVPGGMHDLQVWNEATCDRAWGGLWVRLGEWIRVKLDLEDWPAFIRSFDDLVELLGELGGAGRASHPATISVLSGDIHFSYVSEIEFPREAQMQSRVHQLVNSPIRNALRPHERLAMRWAMSRVASVLFRVLRRGARRRRTPVTWAIDEGPVFENCIGRLDFDGLTARLLLEQAKPYDARGGPQLDDVVTVDLVRGARAGGKLSRKGHVSGK